MSAATVDPVGEVYDDRGARYRCRIECKLNWRGTCRGCGCDHDLLTEDCNYCRRRMWARLYREAQRAA